MALRGIAVSFLIGITLMLYLLFFFLRDGHRLVERLVRILPLGDARERHLFNRFAEVVRATITSALRLPRSTAIRAARRHASHA